jgi:type I restriction enzyme, S subunit
MLEYGLQDDDKQTILDILTSYPQVEDVILFGSRALNTFKATSDIDLAIKGKDIHTILAALIADFEESDLIYEVDLVDYAGISTEKLLEHIDRHGKVFYRKEWVETTLGEVVNIKYGKDHKHLGNGAYPLYGSGGIMRHVEKPLYEKESILIPRKGTLSNLFYVDKPFWSVDTIFYTEIDNKKVNPLFLFYKLKTINLAGLDVGSAVPSLTTKVLNPLELYIPLPSEQKTIANILSSFDEKIELLHEQNKTLGTLAQTIFKEWFVNFNYPGATGEMVDSELGEIPTGWQVKTIDELIELIIDYRGKTPKKLGMVWSDSGIPALSAKTIKNGKIVRRDAMNIGSKDLYDIWMKDELERKDILLTSEAPLGEMYYLSDDTKYILSQRLFALRTNKEITSEYLYHYLFSPLGQYLLKSRASGSTVEGIRQSELRKIEVILPEKEVMERASDIFASVFEKTDLNDKQIQNLIKTRDSLLAKLMSGEVRVQGIIQ